MNELRSPEQIEREITQLRAQLDHTLDAVQEKLSPGELLDQALTYVKEETGLFANNFGRSLRDNPVPATLLGVSIAWLMYASNRPPSPDVGGGRARWSGADSKASELAGQARDLVQRGEDLGRNLTGKTSDLTERAAQVAGTAAARLRTVRDETRAGLHATGTELAHGGAATIDFLKRNPLCLAAIALAAGAITAALLPRTEREDELMGAERDELLRKAKETATSTVERTSELEDREAGRASRTTEIAAEGVAPRVAGDGAAEPSRSPIAG